VTPKALKDSVLAGVVPALVARGFRFVKSKERFEKREQGTLHLFQLVFLDGADGCRVSPNIGVRIDAIEEIFHRTSGFAPKYQKDTPTVGTDAWRLIGNPAFEFSLSSPGDAADVAAGIVSVFESVAQPYFAEFSSIAAVDAALNEEPLKPSVHRLMEWLRCSTGAIAASLVRRPGRSKLFDIYTKKMSTFMEGAYLPRFRALIESLEDDSA